MTIRPPVEFVVDLYNAFYSYSGIVMELGIQAVIGKRTN